MQIILDPLSQIANHANHTPADIKSWALPHDVLRAGQADSIRWCLGIAPGKVGIIQAPTGSGKTSFAAALGSQAPVISLVKSKYLQQENYGGSYGFDVLYGRSNYRCSHGDVLRLDSWATAEDCIYPSAMPKCEYADQCGYLQAKLTAQASDRASLNYAYWLTARWPRESAQTVVCDEAHLLSDVTLDHASCTVKSNDKVQWDLPDFPYITARVPSLGSARFDLVYAWVTDAEKRLPKEYPGMSKQDKKGARLRSKLSSTRQAMEQTGQAWFFRSGPDVLIARPLTARYHFPRYFLGPWRTLLMSATIGDVDTYTHELGIEQYAWRDTPSLWAPETRPVVALDVPRLSAKSGEIEYAEQAEAIVQALQGVPRDWYGIIHVTRKTEAAKLATRLGKLSYDAGRFWTPGDTMSTEQALQAWTNYKRRRPGAIAVAWQWWEGFDGREERICIVAKTPFPNLGDEYEQERMGYDGRMFLQRAAWQLEQALGRTRRGADGDYDTAGQQRGLVAIADGNWRRVQKYLSASLRAALVEG